MKIEIQDNKANNIHDLDISKLEINISNIKALFSKSADCVIREINLNSNLSVFLVFIDGLVNQSYLSEYILKPLITDSRLADSKTEQMLIDEINKGSIYFPSIKDTHNLNEVLESILMGSAAIIFNHEQTGFLFDTKGFDKRTISVPTEETNLKGPKDSFVETIRVNTASIRRKLRTPDLIIEEMAIGKVSNTLISMSYIKGIVDEKLVAEAKSRLEKIEVDQVLFSTVIEESIVDDKYTPFPQIEYTEKPEKFCSALMDGRIGILIDGIPFSMIIPTTVGCLFQTTDDYSYNFMTGSILRVLRYALSALALLAPAFYVSITSFHIEMIPESLAQAIIETEQGVPFPIFIECAVLILAFQTLIEAGARIWSSIGGMISLVGALIVGEAAIKASYISPGVVVVVAGAAIANFSIPNKDLGFAIWIWQLILLMLSSILGLFGMMVGVILFFYHLAQMEVLETPYLAPFASTDGKNMSDSFVRTLFTFRKKQPIDEQNESN